MRKSWTTILIALALLAATAYAFYYMSYWAARGGQTAPLFSTRRYDPYGAAAMKEILEAQDLNVQTIEKSSLPLGSKGVLIQIQQMPDRNIFAAPRSMQVETRAEWVEQGNTIIQFVTHPSRLMEHLDPSEEDNTKINPNAPVAVQQQIQNAMDGWGIPQMWQDIQPQLERGRPPEDVPFSWSPGTWVPDAEEKLGISGRLDRSIRLANAIETLPVKQEDGWIPLATMGRIRTVVAMRKHGEGKLVVVASPTPVLNFSIAEAGNLDMLLALVDGKNVFIDDWSHGVGRGRSILDTISELGLMPLVLQIVFIVGLYSWSTWGRRQTEKRENKRRRSSSEQVVSLGHLYETVMTTQEVVARSRTEARRRLSSIYRCTPESIPDRIGRDTGTGQNGKTLQLLQSIEHHDAATNAYCKQCGYNLYGVDSDNCPECGSLIPVESAPQAITHKPVELDDKNVDREMRTKAVHWLNASHELLKESKRDRRT